MVVFELHVQEVSYRGHDQLFLIEKQLEVVDHRGAQVHVRDEPVVIHCYTTPERIEDAEALSELGSFCRLLGRESNQGEAPCLP